MTEILKEITKEQTVINQLLLLQERFMNIKIGNKSIRCPFFMNNDPLYLNTKHYQSVPKGGKLTPEEIETKILQLAEKNNVNLDMLTQEQLNEFLLTNGIGVDCSGLIYQFLKQTYLALGGTAENFEKSITNESGQTGITKIGTQQLLSENNSCPIEDLSQIKPGDFIIRLGNYYHSVIIVSVNSRTLNCLHASNEIKNSGVNPFRIKIIDYGKSIFCQN